LVCSKSTNYIKLSVASSCGAVSPNYLQHYCIAASSQGKLDLNQSVQLYLPADVFREKYFH
jgi:hypothetical protein